MQLAKLLFRWLHFVNLNSSQPSYILPFPSPSSPPLPHERWRKKKSENSISAFSLKARCWNGDFFFQKQTFQKEMSFATFWLSLTLSYVCLWHQRTAACVAHAPTAISHAPPVAGSRNLRCLTKNSHRALWQLRQEQTDLEAIWNSISSWFSDTFLFPKKSKVYIFLWKISIKKTANVYQ